jgi:hypothetical protein
VKASETAGSCAAALALLRPVAAGNSAPAPASSSNLNFIAPAPLFGADCSLRATEGCAKQRKKTSPCRICKTTLPPLPSLERSTCSARTANIAAIGAGERSFVKHF